MPADSRMPHHMPVHSSYPPPGPGYSNPHQMHHHPSNRSNGPPPGMPVGGRPPPMAVPGPPPNMPPMGGPPPPEAVAPPPPPGPSGPVSNGHGHGTPVPTGLSAAARAGKEKQDSILAQLSAANENTWMLIGAVSEQMNDQDRALAAFENALRHNPNSILGLNAVASIARSRDEFDKAIDYFQRILNIKQDNGEVWGSMGHCLLMKDDLPKAYTAYQQALHYLPNPKEPKLWYGIGILYDRYGSFEHAEEAFSSVLKMDPAFEKANEIYFRLGIIYKHQRKYSHSLDCFRYIINDPPRPLTSWDIWFQLGHVYELDQDYVQARDAYMRVLGHQPDHAKVLQQLGWLYHQPGAPFANQEQAVQYLTKSLETDGTDAQSWYLLGRAFMAGQRYNKAYEAYQQAVYRDGRNPTFWCSIGVLYFQINQYRDALDAYSRAIRLNPYISEVWYNLGSLYESCNNQITDAIDAYSRAVELDPNNNAIKHRLQLLQAAGQSNAPLPPPPAPVDVHPSQYSGPPGGGQAANGSQPGSPHPNPQAPPPVQGGGQDREQLQPGQGGRELPSLPADYRGGGGGGGASHPDSTFRGGAAAPPPLALVDESRGSMSRHAPLAPIDTERPEPRDLRESYRDGPPFNGQGGGPPAPTRFDPTAETRRHAPSPGSPRRRGEPPQGYPGYPAQHPQQYRDREREEWERRGGDPRGMPPYGDMRGPSPRPGMHPGDPRGPGGPRDPREFPAEAAGFPPYGPGYERGGPYPPQHDGRDPRRERFEEHEAKPRIEYANGRQPSQTRDVAHADLRAPSPAASTSSKASGRRKVSGKDDPTKRLKKDSTKGRRPNGDEASPRPSPRPSPAPSQSRQPAAPPRRTVDEDYDEGVDALMTLHNERRAPSVSGSIATDKATSPVTGTKRPSPPSPEMRGSKKSKASTPTGASSPTRRTVIEVLNPTPAIEVLNNPNPASTDFMKAGEKERRSPDRPSRVSAPTSPKDDKSERERERGQRDHRHDAERERDAAERTSAARVSPKTPEKASSAAHRSPQSAPRSPVTTTTTTGDKDKEAAVSPGRKSDGAAGADKADKASSVAGSKPASKAGSKAGSPAAAGEDVEMKDAERRSRSREREREPERRTSRSRSPK